MATRKEKKLTNMQIIGRNVEKYRKMMIVFASLIAAVALFFCIYWNFDENSAGQLQDTLYLFSHIFFLVNSVTLIVLLILNKFGHIKTRFLAYILHIYSFFLIGWSTVLCVLDLNIGLSPFIYLLACTLVAGLFVTEPIFYTASIITSLTVIIVMSIIRKYPFFLGNDQIEDNIENFVNFIIYTVLVTLICVRQFRVTIREAQAMDKLHTLTYYDELTGLLNERSYLEEIDKIAKDIESNKIEDFAVILMDVNNLKATNDQYGHRYGCSLVVRCGHTIPTIFKSSKMFHIGGDEFLVIVRGEDLSNFEETMKHFDDTMLYSIVNYEGVDLIFSVARGYSHYKKGDRYQDVLQRADSEMYINKKMLKEKYGMKGR